LLSSGGARLREPAPPRAATNAEEFARLSRAAGNRAGARILARRPYDAQPPIKDRTRIDQLAKTKGQSAADRCRAYAEIAGTQSVQMDPTAVHTSAFYHDGVNLDALKQARDVLFLAFLKTSSDGTADAALPTPPDGGRAIPRPTKSGVFPSPDP
jgi:hypothetical protein